MAGATEPGRVIPFLADHLARTLSTTPAILQVVVDVEVQPLFCVLKGTTSKLLWVWMLQRFLPVGIFMASSS